MALWRAPTGEEVEAELAQGGVNKLQEWRQAIARADDAANAVATAAALARSRAGPGATVFGVACMQDVMRMRYEELGTQGMGALVEEAVATLRDCADAGAEYAGKSKAAALLSEAVLRARTHSWATVLDAIEPGAQGNPSTSEAVSLALKSFSEDAAVLREGSASSSSGEVLSELMGTLPRALSFLASAISNPPGNSGSAVVAAAQAASAFSEWAPLAELEQNGIIAALGERMRSGPAWSRLRAAEAIRPLCLRKPSQSEASAAAHVCVSLARAMESSLAHFPGGLNPENQAEHELVCTIVEAAAAAMEAHAGPLAKYGAGDAAKELFASALRVTRTGCLTVVAPLLPAWNHALRGPAKHTAPAEELAEAAAEWLYEGGGCLSGLSGPSGAGDAWQRELSLAEAGEELFEAWAVARNSLRQQCQPLASELAPEAVARSAGRLLSRAASKWASNGGGDQGAVCALEGAASFAEPSLASLPSQLCACPPQELAEGLSAVLNLSPPSAPPDTVSRAAHALSEALESCRPLYAQQPGAGAGAIRHLLSLLANLPRDPESAGRMPARAREGPGGSGLRASQLARQRACSALVGCCAGADGSLAGSLDSLYSEVSALDLQGAERSAMVEALVALGGKQRAAEVAAWALSDALPRMAAYAGCDGYGWGQANSKSTSESNRLLELLNGRDESSSEERWRIFHDVQVADRALRRACTLKEGPSRENEGGTSYTCHGEPDEATQEMLHRSGALSPGLMALCTLANKLHAIFRNPSSVASDFRECLGVSPEEEAAAVAQGPARHPPTGDSPGPIQERRSWLRGLRDSLYMAIAALASHAPCEFFDDPQGSEQAARAAMLLVDAATSMEPRHLAALLKTPMQAIYRRATPSSRPVIFSNSLQQVLEAVWHLIQSAQPKSEGQEQDAPSALELHRERAWREAARESQVVLMAVVQHPSEARPSKGKLRHASKGLWMDDIPIESARSLLRCASACLASKDSKACSKALALCRAVAGSKPVRNSSGPAGQAIAEELAESTAPGALTALRSQSNAAHSSELVGLVADALVTCPRHSSLPDRMAASLGVGREELIAAADASKGEKEQRQRLRSLLLERCGGPGYFPSLSSTSPSGLVVHSSLQQGAQRAAERRVSRLAESHPQDQLDEEAAASHAFAPSDGPA